jgi:hypothetical protein
MNLRTTVTVGAALAAISITGCFPKPGVAPGPLSEVVLASAQERWPDSSPESLEKGRQIFLASCDSCHSYPDMAYYPEEKWPTIMKRMGHKSDLSDADWALALQFVLVARTAPPAVEGAAAK